jgi:hypothetical protein
VTPDASTVPKIAQVHVFAVPVMELLPSSKATTSSMRRLASRTSATTRVLIVQRLNIRSVTIDVFCVKTRATFVKFVL